MNSSIKSKIPLLFLIAISISWGFYYQSNGRLNDFGAANFEWLYLIDGLLVLPALCFLCIEDKKQALLKAVLFSCLVVMIGSYIIPEKSKFVWHYLESGRYFILGLVLLIECIAISTVYLAIKSTLNLNGDPDLAIEEPINRFLGETLVAKLLSFEIRMWTYALFAGRINTAQFRGKQHFSYHQKDGAESNLLGFIILIIFELPIMHLLLHFLWSPLVANVVTVLTIFSLVFFIAEFRAVSRRPISLADKELIIRCGIYQRLTLPLSNIANIRRNSNHIKRSRSVKRYDYSGAPNILVELIKPIGDVNRIYLGVDEPDALATAVLKQMEQIKT